MFDRSAFLAACELLTETFRVYFTRTADDAADPATDDAAHDESLRESMYERMMSELRDELIRVETGDIYVSDYENAIRCADRFITDLGDAIRRRIDETISTGERVPNTESEIDIGAMIDALIAGSVPTDDTDTDDDTDDDS